MLIYLKVLDYPVIQLNFSSKSKAKIRRKISHFLEDTTDRTFYDSFGHKVFRDKHFRLDRFRFDAGKQLFIMKNR